MHFDFGLIRCAGCDEFIPIGTTCLNCGYQDPYKPEPDDAPEDHGDEADGEGDHERYDPEFSAA